MELGFNQSIKETILGGLSSGDRLGLVLLLDGFYFIFLISASAFQRTFT